MTQFGGVSKKQRCHSMVLKTGNPEWLHLPILLYRKQLMKKNSIWGKTWWKTFQLKPWKWHSLKKSTSPSDGRVEHISIHGINLSPSYQFAVFKLEFMHNKMHKWKSLWIFQLLWLVDFYFKTFPHILCEQIHYVCLEKFSGLKNKKWKLQIWWISAFDNENTKLYGLNIFVTHPIKTE